MQNDSCRKGEMKEEVSWIPKPTRAASTLRKTAMCRAFFRSASQEERVRAVRNQGICLDRSGLVDIYP